MKIEIVKTPSGKYALRNENGTYAGFAKTEEIANQLLNQQCSSLCAIGETCSVSNDGKCLILSQQ